MKKIPLILFLFLQVPLYSLAQICPSLWQVLPENWESKRPPSDTVWISKVNDDIYPSIENLDSLFKIIPAPSIPIDTLLQGIPLKSASDLSGEAKVFFDNHYLYFLFRVKDDDVQDTDPQDKIELGFAPYNDSVSLSRNIYGTGFDIESKTSDPTDYVFENRIVSNQEYLRMALRGYWYEQGAYHTTWKLEKSDSTNPYSFLYDLKGANKDTLANTILFGKIPNACKSNYLRTQDGYYFVALIPWSMFSGKKPDKVTFPVMNLMVAIRDIDSDNYDGSGSSETYPSYMYGATDNKDAYFAIGYYGAKGIFRFEDTIPVYMPPYDLSLQRIDSVKVGVHWKYSNTSADSFILHKSYYSDFRSFQRIAVPGNIKEIIDTVSTTKNYVYYKISAKNKDIQSGFSEAKKLLIGSSILIMENGNFYVCSSIFTDPGGDENYSGYVNKKITLYPQKQGYKLNIHFEQFSLNPYYDYLYIYNGLTQSASTFLGSFTGSDLPNDIRSSDSTGALTLIFTGYSQGTYPGWLATLECKPFGKPLKFIGKLTEEDKIQLEWQNKELFETAVVIEKSTYSTFSDKEIIVLPKDATSYLDEDVDSTSRFYYRIYFKNAEDSSVYSDPLLISVKDIIMHTGTVYTCAARLMDPGGLSDYENDKKYILTLYPATSGNFIQLIFNSFALGYNDYLRIYCGPTKYDYYESFYFDKYNVPNNSITSNHSTGAITLEFTSDSYNTASGWDAQITCTDLRAPYLSYPSVQRDFIKLSWYDYNTNEDGFIIERSDSNTRIYKFLAKIQGNNNSYEDRSVSVSHFYSYRVKAYNENHESDFSSSRDVYSACADFDSIKVTYVAEEGVRVKPYYPSQYLESIESQYYIYRSTLATSNFQYMGSMSKGSNYYTDQTVSPSTTYYYFASTSNGYSQCNSDTVKIVLPKFYCRAASNYTGDVQIKSVQVGEQRKENNQYCSSYGFTNDFYFSAALGDVVPSEIAIGPCYTYSNKSIIKVFCDWNGDLDFQDPNELVATSTAMNSPGTFQFSITVPDKAPETVRLRIVCAQTTYENEVNACMNYFTGETEDYQIQILKTPAPPKNLKASIYSPTEVKLQWEDKSTNENGFLIDRMTSSGLFERIDTVQKDLGMYIDKTIDPEKEYTYRVATFNAYGSSNFSGIATIVTGPAAPTNLTGNLVSSNVIQLGWEDNSSCEDYYILERSDDKGKTFKEIAVLSKNIILYQDFNFPEGSQLIYRIKCNNEIGYSDFSNLLIMSSNSIAKNASNAGIRIYPNPSSGKIWISFLQNTSSELSICSTEGKILKTIPFNANQNNSTLELDISDLPSGSYTIIIKTTKDIYRERLIKL